MKKKVKVGDLNGFGIFVAIVLALVFIIVQYNRNLEQPFHMRIIIRLAGCFVVILGAGAIMLAFFFAFYAANEAAKKLFVQDENEERPKDDIIDLMFRKYSNTLLVVAITISYVYFLFSFEG